MASAINTSTAFGFAAFWQQGARSGPHLQSVFILSLCAVIVALVSVYKINNIHRHICITFYSLNSHYIYINFYLWNAYIVYGKSLSELERLKLNTKAGYLSFPWQSCFNLRNSFNITYLKSMQLLTPLLAQYESLSVEMIDLEFNSSGP